jgi:plastocyanin
MKRREFFEKAGFGSAAFVSLSALTSGDSGKASASVTRGPERAEHQHEDVDGPLANAVVSFGQWRTEPPRDRFPNVPPPPSANNHQLIPKEATIKAGGAVMFVLSGLHNVVVYDDGTLPQQINVTDNLQATTGVPAGVPIINDANNRIYRGPDPSLLPLDRSETVHFPRPGRYLVICGVRPHFVNDGMYGFVRVLP